MKKILLLLAITGFFTVFSACKKQHAYSALIITGQNNHNWQASSKILKQLLDQTKLFSTDIIETPAQGGDMNLFKPDFQKYDVVVMDYTGDSWPENTKAEFLDFVRNGGGVVIYHAADNAFPEWKEYNEMIGLGGWGNRSEKDGPYIYMKNDSLITDTTKGPGGSHGNRHEFVVKIRNAEHPVTKGLPNRWLHAEDELYSELRGPAKNMEILATAFADTAQGGTGRDELVLFTVNYGKGRIFHTTIGHAGNGDKSFPALECLGFITTFQRGTEWAASGVVTQEIPQDFPNAASVVQLEDYLPLTMEQLMVKIENYDIAKSRKFFYDLQNRMRSSDGKPETLLSFEKQIVKSIKKNGVTNDAKKLLIRELSWMGSGYSIPVLKEIVNTVELKDEAQFALARLEPK
ncbi:MAG: ThuA domain-containing protein [Bacteroidales bacterium]|nr:ThuA domain-containing protein [Bacteroidales bacterium]